MSDYVTKKDWEIYCQQERAKYFARREERDRRDHERWLKEHQRLMNPPKPPPRREEPSEPTVEDVGYVDWLYARGGSLAMETKSEDVVIARGTRARRKPSTVKRRGGGDLVDSYT